MKENFFDLLFDPFLNDRTFEVAYARGDKAVGKIEDGFYKVEADVPGVKKEDLKVSVRGRVLKIAGKRGESEVVRTFFLPEGEYGQTKARLENGVLYVEVPLKSADLEIKIE